MNAQYFDYGVYGFGLDADTLTELQSATKWLRDNRVRIHTSDCTVHKPSAQCSCGLHHTLSTLGFVGNDIEAALAALAAPKAGRCDGNHAQVVPCADPNCWQGEDATRPLAAPKEAGNKPGGDGMNIGKGDSHAG